MASVLEKAYSRKLMTGKSASYEISYLALGYSDEISAKDAALAVAPVTYLPDAYDPANILFRDGVAACDELSKSAGLWDVTVRYAAPDRVNSPPGTVVSRFSTVGGTAHRIVNIANVSANIDPKGKDKLLDFNGLIGDTKDGIEGVDITVPVYEWSETHVYSPSVITTAFCNAIYVTTGKVNSAPFRMFAKGECLFKGADGAPRSDGSWDVTYHFSGSQNMVFDIGQIKGVAKRGWEYLWMSTSDTVNQLTGVLSRHVRQVNVEQVYYYADFGAALGI